VLARRLVPAVWAGLGVGGWDLGFGLSGIKTHKPRFFFFLVAHTQTSSISHRERSESLCVCATQKQKKGFFLILENAVSCVVHVAVCGEVS
jgi:hypothetical protein